MPNYLIMASKPTMTGGYRGEEIEYNEAIAFSVNARDESRAREIFKLMCFYNYKIDKIEEKVK